MNFLNTPVEPDHALRFATRLRRKEHVIKHLIEGRDERWHQITNPTTLASARDEHSQGKWGASCESLAATYESFLADIIDDACSKGHSHHHVAMCSLDDCLEPARVQSLEIECWHAGNGIFVAAGAKCYDGNLTSYRIRTGYRLYPKLRHNAFLRRLHERNMEKARLRHFVVVATHDVSRPEGSFQEGEAK